MLLFFAPPNMKWDKEPSKVVHMRFQLTNNDKGVLRQTITFFFKKTHNNRKQKQHFCVQLPAKLSEKLWFSFKWEYRKVSILFLSLVWRSTVPHFSITIRYLVLQHNVFIDAQFQIIIEIYKYFQYELCDRVIKLHFANRNPELSVEKLCFFLQNFLLCLYMKFH